MTEHEGTASEPKGALGEHKIASGNNEGACRRNRPRGLRGEQRGEA